ncbi:Got1/Sft2-like family-domain-containing protein [Catenaria anguillulae PL171]|uniref:Protein transport protein SFT2 n=1 Tax=Catenaria anguillulae PL171 TaxID=765915 RepID=A0A1Y2HV93_9FUNG|nr:Got1/Sft2-like family-domain-containing protein [Catenaria anguillulae PL171]
MAESSFQSSLRAFQQSRANPAPPTTTATSGSSGSWTRWMDSMRGGSDDQAAEEGRGLLSGLMPGTNSRQQQQEVDARTRAFEVACGCCPALSASQRFIVFACCTGGGLLFFFLSFFMLPMLVIAPQKFAFLSCMGSLLLFSSLGFLRGWPGHMAAVFSKDRWPFSVGYLLSLVGGLWASVIIHSYLLTIVFIILHTVALVWYYMSFLPGGISGLRVCLFGPRGGGATTT